MAIEYLRIAAVVLDRKVARLAEPLVLHRGGACAYSTARSTGAAGEVLACAEEAGCTRHVDEAAVAREVLDMADRCFAFIVLLLRRDGIVPNSAVLEHEREVVVHVESCPLRVRTGHLDPHPAVGKALPIGGVLHEETHFAILALRHAVAVRIGIAADPVRVRRRETNGDASPRAHAAVRDDIALKDGTILSCAIGKAVSALCDVEVDRTVIFRIKLAISAYSCPGIAGCTDGAAADVDARGNGADALVRTQTVRIGPVREHINKTVDRDVRLCAIKTVHCLDDGGACLLLADGAQCEHFVLKIIAAVSNMDGAAAIGKERGGVQAARVLSSNGNRTRILDIDLCILLGRGNTCDRRVRRRHIQCQLLPVHINVERLRRIRVRNGGSNVRRVWPSIYGLRAVRRDCRVLCERVVPVTLTHTRCSIRCVMRCIVCDGGCELRLRLRIRLGIDRRRIGIAALAAGCAERDVFKTLACGGCRQAFGDLDLAREVALACCIGRIVELLRECVERCIHAVFVCCLRGLRIESGIVRREGDGTVCRRLADRQITADDVCRCSGFVGVEHLCMAAVAVDRDGLCILLENHARMIGIAAAREPRHTAALPRIVCA